MQQPTYRFGSGVLTGSGSGATVNNHGDSSVSDCSPDVFEQGMIRVVATYLDVCFEDLGPVTNRRLDVCCGPRFGIKRRGGETIRSRQRELGSPLTAARERGVEATVGDLRSWTPQPDTDVVLSNAALHWLPERDELMVRWAQQLGAGAWIAIQMPGNVESPSHSPVRAVARRAPYAKTRRDTQFRVGNVVDSPAHYAALLIDAGCTVDAWETTHIHQLAGENPSWIGSAAPRCFRCVNGSTSRSTNSFARSSSRRSPTPVRRGTTGRRSSRSGGSSPSHR